MGVPALELRGEERVEKGGRVGKESLGNKGDVE